MFGLSKYAKFVTAAIGVATLLATTYFPGKYDHLIAAVVSIATALGVYLVPNAEPAE